MLLSYTSGDQIEPEISIGRCSSKGLCDYASDVGDCGGLVIAVSDGAILGTHIAGGKACNRFEPVDEERMNRIRSDAATLVGMDFQ